LSSFEITLFQFAISNSKDINNDDSHLSHENKNAEIFRTKQYDEKDRQTVVVMSNTLKSLQVSFNTFLQIGINTA
jgi:hypothetical protein